MLGMQGKCAASPTSAAITLMQIVSSDEPQAASELQRRKSMLRIAARRIDDAQSAPAE